MEQRDVYILPAFWNMLCDGVRVDESRAVELEDLFLEDRVLSFLLSPSYLVRHLVFSSIGKDLGFDCFTILYASKVSCLFQRFDINRHWIAYHCTMNERMSWIVNLCTLDDWIGSAYHRTLDDWIGSTYHRTLDDWIGSA